MSSRFCVVASTPDDSIAGADIVLPCQYYDISGGYNLSGEQRLMLALLTDAINVYQRGALSRRTRARRLYVDAEHWMLTERLSGNALSFNTVCEALGIDAALLRRRIVDWKHTVHRHHRGSNPSSRLQFKITSRDHRRRPPNMVASNI
jgi:hypothetical protein